MKEQLRDPIASLPEEPAPLRVDDFFHEKNSGSKAVEKAPAD
jgi:hypothetical protein